jgi:hypothetical protein
LSGLVLCFGSFVYGAETFSSATLLDGKSWSFSAYGRSVKSEPTVNFSGIVAVSVPTSGGTSTVFSGNTADVELEQESADVTISASFRPREGLVYTGYVGQIQQFELDFSSGSQTNSLRSTSDGWRWGLSVSGGITPLSPVSVGVNWSLGYTQTKVNLDRLRGGDLVYAVDNALTQQEFQGALQAVMRVKSLEPYIGLKIIHLQTQIDDKASKHRVKGEDSGVSPLIGVRWAIFDREFLQIEASFLDEESVAAGFAVQF